MYSQTITQTIVRTNTSQSASIEQSQLLSRDKLITKNIKALLQGIQGSHLFTLEQKNFVKGWEPHFMQLLGHPKPLLAVKAVCFLKIKVLTPTWGLYKDNRLALKQLLPVFMAQRDLLTALLPSLTDVDEFAAEREDNYSLMLEIIPKLQNLQVIHQKTEQLIDRLAGEKKQELLTQLESNRELMQYLAGNWHKEIDQVHKKLLQLTEKATVLHEQFKTHARELEGIGTQLIAEKQQFQSSAEELKYVLNKV